ncbi:MAG: alpha-E domain-containing protein [Sulfurospirillaceae bacterium]|nr:alpha-E domain-containing protein [Sulfurospirillaceae bacterium]MDD2825984.1 alpha-E domain-containing protein [Sulfurospirillaceae bacterium]
MILISPQTAEHLFWIGRYIQRAESMSRLVIDIFDKIIDHNPQESHNFYAKLGLTLDYQNNQEFLRQATFDLEFVSLLSIVNNARENAVLARASLPNRMFSRINGLYLRYQIAKDEPKTSIFWLESTLQELDAIWGNLELNIAHMHEKDLIQLGRIIEKMDLNIRLFDSLEATALDVARLNNLLAKLGQYNAKVSLHSSDPLKTLHTINSVYKTMVEVHE